MYIRSGLQKNSDMYKREKTIDRGWQMSLILLKTKAEVTAFSEDNVWNGHGHKISLKLHGHKISLKLQGCGFSDCELRRTATYGWGILPHHMSQYVAVWWCSKITKTLSVVSISCVEHCVYTQCSWTYWETHQMPWMDCLLAYMYMYVLNSLHAVNYIAWYPDPSTLGEERGRGLAPWHGSEECAMLGS